MKHGKKYVEASKKVDSTKLYDASEALGLAVETSTAKFDETIELHVKLGVDPKNADQQVRGSVVLPHGTGKSVKVLVIAKGDKADVAKANGADFVGAEDMIEKISKENWFDFDSIVATPEMMVELGKIGKVLGPKGLMPNPKTGTVTTNVEAAIENIKKGMIEYRADSNGNVHALIGKVSFSEKDLEENLVSFVKDVLKNKPTGVKGVFVKNISISSTMGPGVKLDITSF